MENLIEAIEEKTKGVSGNMRKDGIINIASVKELNVDKKAMNAKKNEAIDFFSMKFKEVLRVIKEDKEARVNDYFKFDFYMGLAKEEMMVLLKNVKVPFGSIKKVFEHLITFDSPNDILMVFIGNNEECLIEQSKLLMLRKSLRLTKNEGIVEEITRSTIDGKHMMDLIALGRKKDGIVIEEWVKIAMIALRKHKNGNEWVRLVKNLLTIAVIKKEIDKERYDEIIKEFEEVKENNKTKCKDKGKGKEKDSDGDEKIEGWNMELYQKLINKKGVMIETITI